MPLDRPLLCNGHFPALGHTAPASPPGLGVAVAVPESEGVGLTSGEASGEGLPPAPLSLADGDGSLLTGVCSGEGLSSGAALGSGLAEAVLLLSGFGVCCAGVPPDVLSGLAAPSA